MVYLTFIKREEICSHGWLLPNNICQLYSLTKFLAQTYGNPSVLATAYDDASISNAKLVNLVFGVHGIMSTRTLTDKSSENEGKNFIQSLISKMDVENHHVAVVVPDSQFEQFSVENNPFVLGCVYSAENWQALSKNIERTMVYSRDVPIVKPDEATLNRFTDAIAIGCLV